MTPPPIRKYPRTRHVEGSRLQVGDDDLEAAPFSELRGRHLVIEEKLDGANAGVSFAEDGSLLLQSRGHYLTGGSRERHFALFKQWAHTHVDRLRRALGHRCVLYGEWLYAKHAIFYDLLPHYFMEFDVLDTKTGEFLDTPRRASLLAGLPVVPVRVLHSGRLFTKGELVTMAGRSAFVSADHAQRLTEQCRRLGLDADQVRRETDTSGEMEGLYVKVEEHGAVRERFKYIRPSFLAAVVAAEGHWLNKPIVPNLLRPGADVFATTTGSGDGDAT
jgi:hypothetical protein